MTDSYEIMNSVFEWLKIIETKIFVDDGMLLRMKITLTIWEHKNTSTIRTNGGFTPVSKVLIPCHWEIVLISSKRCLPCNDWNKKQKKNHMCLLTLTSTNNGRHRVLFLYGGIGKVHGVLLIPMKVAMEMKPSTDRIGTTCCTIFGIIFLGKTFLNSITLLQMDRLQLTAVYCNRRWVWAQHLKWHVFAVQKCAFIGYR